MRRIEPGGEETLCQSGVIYLCAPLLGIAGSGQEGLAVCSGGVWRLGRLWSVNEQRSRNPTTRRARWLQRCGYGPYLISVIPTPAQVLPIIECAIPSLANALRVGAAFADDLQPSPFGRDPWYWSASARWKARGVLAAETDSDRWCVAERVPNSGIHLCVDDIHKVRVLRSLDGTTPHAGRNLARRQAWFQDALLLGRGGDITALSLIADWQFSGDEPVIHVGMPKAPGSFGLGAELHWRVPVTGDAGYDLGNLSFDPGNPPDDISVTLKFDPAESQDAG
jgi:hypothetical protein